VGSNVRRIGTAFYKRGPHVWELGACGNTKRNISYVYIIYICGFLNIACHTEEAEINTRSIRCHNCRTSWPYITLVYEGAISTADKLFDICHDRVNNLCFLRMVGKFYKK